MNPATAPSAVKVQAVLGERFTVLEFEAGTRTAADAAAAIGCAVAEIAKSLVFRTATSGRPVLVVASGDKRVDCDRGPPTLVFKPNYVNRCERLPS